MRLISIILFLIILFMGSKVLSLITPYNNTDDALSETRSGLWLYHDNLTGCQYIKAGIFGNTIPRVNGSGKHIGCFNK